MIKETNNYVKLKRYIYLAIIPILALSSLRHFEFSPHADHFDKFTLPTLIILLAVAWVFVYRNKYIFSLEILFLCIFSIMHIYRIMAVTNHLELNSSFLYLFWAPMYYIFSFMILNRFWSLILSLFIFLITLANGLPHMFHSQTDRDILIHIFITHLLYIVVMFFFQKLGTWYIEADMLKRLAFEDFLTQIANRRKLEKILDREIELTQTSKSAFSVIYFDIDHFKNINDKYGHEVGDQVLKELAALVKINISSNHYFGRWGGEEFLIVLPNYSLKETIDVAEHLRSIIQIYLFPEVGNVTASFGVSTYIENDLPRTILWRADVALYEAKLKGRNNVRTHTI